jgi:hypothetical protein
MKSMKLSEYFELINPKYATLQLVPSTSNRNYDTELIVTTISNMTQTPLAMRFKKEALQKGFRLTYHRPEKVLFIIDIQKDDCRFYLIVPERYKTVFIAKCSEVWKRVTVKELDSMPEFVDGIRYGLQYTKTDALSLKVNKKSNEPLNNIMVVKSILEADDKVQVINNFIPMSQQRWKGMYSTAMGQLKAGLPIDKQKLNAAYLSQLALAGAFALIDFLFSLIDGILDGKGTPKKQNQYIHDRIAQLSPFTIKKETAQVLQMQALICSYSQDKLRATNNARTVIESYKIISQDNSISSKKIEPKNKIDVLKPSMSGVPIMIISTAEGNNFIHLPGRDLIQSMNVATKVDVLENPVPEELQTGNIPLGVATVKDTHQSSFLPSEYNMANLALVLLGPQGSGKSNFIANFCKYSCAAKEANVIIDYIKNCELSDAVQRAVSKNNQVIIDLSTPEGFQSFAFNEIEYTGKDEFRRFEAASMKSEQTLSFVDAINKDGIPLTGNMRRVLDAAANVTYLHSNTSIGDVIACLERHEVRGQYIQHIKDNISHEGQEYLRDMVEALTDLDKIVIEIDKNTKQITRREVVGTKRNEIDGILDRVNLLKENINCRYMFSMKPSNNVNILNEIEAGKTIIIKMPEHKYSSRMVKNVLCTFFTSKVLLSAKLRGALHDKPARCNVFFDELYQAPTAMGVLTETLAQLRKFGTKVVLSAHHLGQLTKEFKDEVKGSGASYVLFQGCDKDVFKDLQDEMDPYELEDLLHMKQWHTLNLIRTKGGYQKFITALPKPLY